MNATLPRPEYRAVRHILETPQLVDRTLRYIEPDDFDWSGLFAAARTMSSGERLLIRIAHDLWTSGGDVAVSEAAKGLDPHNLDRVVQAIRLFTGRRLAAGDVHRLRAVA